MLVNLNSSLNRKIADYSNHSINDSQITQVTNIVTQNDTQDASDNS